MPGLGMLNRNRPPNSKKRRTERWPPWPQEGPLSAAQRKNLYRILPAHGGVAVLFKKGKLELKQFKMNNPSNFEVIALVGKITGLSRKLVVIACYIPPNYNVP